MGVVSTCAPCCSWSDQRLMRGFLSLPWLHTIMHRPRLLSGLLVVVLATVVAGFADIPDAVQPLISDTVETQEIPTSETETAAPRIPIDREESGNDPQVHPEIAADPECIGGCLVRVATPTSEGALWQRGNVSYIATGTPETAVLATQASGLTVVWPNHETLYLYVMFNVEPAQDALIEQYGTIRDRSGSVRLVEVDRVPLQVSELYAAGIWVEKLPPVAAVAEAPTRQLDFRAEITEIVALGAREGSALGDRQFDSSGTIKAAEYFFQRFAAFGYNVRFEDFTDPTGRQQLNVIAESPGLTKSPRYLITAHYDSISPYGEPAPGADDNGSGLASVLELARRVAVGGFALPVEFVLFGAEEPGLFGSKAYAEQIAKDGVTVAGAINIDSMGIENSGNVYINGDAASRWIYVELVELSSDDYWLEWMANPNFLSDDEYLRRNGFEAVMITTHPWGTQPLHHTPDDRIEHLSIPQIADLTDLVWDWLLLQMS